MATYTTQTVTHTVRRWIIPAAEPWGAAAAEVAKAWSAAEQEYRRLCEVHGEQPLADNVLTFHVSDDEIVISFECEEPAT